jgi:hypothetical protein
MANALPLQMGPAYKTSLSNCRRQAERKSSHRSTVADMLRFDFEGTLRSAAETDRQAASFHYPRCFLA